MKTVAMMDDGMGGLGDRLATLICPHERQMVHDREEGPREEGTGGVCLLRLLLSLQS